MAPMGSSTMKPNTDSLPIILSQVVQSVTANGLSSVEYRVNQFRDG